jgi:RNA polymerase sigma-70 factor, ECF subfamily
MTEKTIVLALQETPQPDADAADVAEARRSSAAFGRLYDRYVQAVFRYLCSRLGSVPEAEDVTAQTFLAALEGFEGYRHQGHFAAWLFSIARSKTADHYRRRPRLADLDEAALPASNPDLLQQVIQSQQAAALASLIGALPDDEHDLISLRYAAGLSFAEIAVLLGKNEDAVKKATYRLVEKLKKAANPAGSLERKE